MCGHDEVVMEIKFHQTELIMSKRFHMGSKHKTGQQQQGNITQIKAFV